MTWPLSSLMINGQLVFFLSSRYWYQKNHIPKSARWKAPKFRALKSSINKSWVTIPENECTHINEAESNWDAIHVSRKKEINREFASKLNLHSKIGDCSNLHTFCGNWNLDWSDPGKSKTISLVLMFFNYPPNFP